MAEKKKAETLGEFLESLEELKRTEGGEITVRYGDTKGTAAYLETAKGEVITKTKLKNGENIETSFLKVDLYQGDQGEAEEQVYIPKSPKVLNNWKAAWKAIEQKYRWGNNYEQLRMALKNKNLRPVYKNDTLRKIIKAGEAGLLDR